MDLGKAIIGGVVTVVIGGTVYTVSQTDVVDNLIQDTGMSQQEAENYVKKAEKEGLVSYTEVGQTYIDDGKNMKALAADINCLDYEYEWQSPTLSCQQGKYQLNKFGNDEITLGNSYIRLDAASATDSDIANTIRLLTLANENYGLEIIKWLLTPDEIEEGTNTNSYNKASLQALKEK